LANGEFVVFCSQDAVPADEHWLACLLENFDDESVAGVYCRQIPRDDADVLTKRHLNAWLTGRGERSVNFIETREAYGALGPWDQYRLCNFDNVCACVRRSVCHEIPCPESYIAEDLEWGKRIIEGGFAWLPPLTWRLDKLYERIKEGRAKELKVVLRRALKLHALERENRELRNSRMPAQVNQDVDAVAVDRIGQPGCRQRGDVPPDVRARRKLSCEFVHPAASRVAIHFDCGPVVTLDHRKRE